MTHLNDILLQISQVAHMDKASILALGYACYLYIIMDGATRNSARRHYYYSHH